MTFRAVMLSLPGPRHVFVLFRASEFCLYDFETISKSIRLLGPSGTPRRPLCYHFQ
jgi:hypothetical protein